jgi:hypothetical protein
MDYEEIEIRKRIEEAKKMKYCAKQQMAQADIQIGEYDLQLLELNKNKEEKISNEIPQTIRSYGASIIERIPVIIDVGDDGTLYTENKKLWGGNIFDLYNLKKLIPQTEKYPSFRKVAKKARLDYTFTQYMCAGIELGLVTNAFEIWESKTHTFDTIPKGQLLL